MKIGEKGYRENSVAFQGDKMSEKTVDKIVFDYETTGRVEHNQCFFAHYEGRRPDVLKCMITGIDCYFGLAEHEVPFDCPLHGGPIAVKLERVVEE